MKQKILKLSVLSLFCALSVVLMLVGCVIQSLDLTVAVAAGLTVAVAVIEYGTGWAVMLYAATSVLSFVLLPAKTPALFYVLIGGIYPIIKALLERIKNRKLVWAIKIIFVYALGNLTFFVYDIAFTRLVTLYVKRIRRKLK